MEGGETMSVSLLCTVLLLTPADSGGDGSDVGRAQYDIPVGSRWEAVRGSKGDYQLDRACIVFNDNETVTIAWAVKVGGGAFSSKGVYHYRVDPESHLPVVRSGFQTGTFRFVGDTLEFELIGLEVFESLPVPAGKLSLVLQPAK
jgi:hypothetical protein